MCQVMRLPVVTELRVLPLQHSAQLLCHIGYGTVFAPTHAHMHTKRIYMYEYVLCERGNYVVKSSY